ncbi:MAG: hypothetical protein NWE89_11760, partial [Candidatus Bathyarchaeota archaeon]|nr:hypothetical protein [Candidatus Bathyarchaeota archaeon]
MQVAKIELDTPYNEETVHVVITEPEKQVEYPSFFKEHYNFYDMVNPVAEITELYYPEKAETVTCYHCDLEVVKGKALKVELYDTPFDSAPDTVYFCSTLCYEAQIGNVYSKDFRYFTCPVCEREICEQNPANGWHVQYRVYQDEQICNKCYEQICFEQGVDRKYFKDGTVHGLFFNDSDLTEHGYI